MQNTVAVISLKTIQKNAEAVKRAAGVPLIAVIKDDAYGHGAEAVAHALSGRVHSFAVSTVAEGASLRNAGVTDGILVLTPPLCDEEVLRCEAYGLTVSLTSPHVLRLCRRTLERYALNLRAHLAVNTGMNRYGFRPERVRAVCREAEGLRIEGVYSHLFLPVDPAERVAQTVLFERAANVVSEYFPGAIRHLGATGGLLSGVKYDAVRPGIALYGYLPEPWSKTIGVQPAVKLYATVSHQCTQLGGGMGYLRAREKGGKVHTLRLGYGDGFFRSGGELCMDAAVVKGESRIGRRERVLTDVVSYAKKHGTTVYEVLVNILRKAEKRYEYSG